LKAADLRRRKQPKPERVPSLSVGDEKVHVLGGVR
jgi:hypothetical protein